MRVCAQWQVAADSERVDDTNHSHAGMIDYVYTALRDCGYGGWANIDNAAVVCTLFHGSNNQVFKLSASGVESVALRVRAGGASDDVDRRARELFSKHGLGPRQLHCSLESDGTEEGVEERCIEEWIGDAPPTFTRLEEFAQWGALCAKIHELPTDWFDEYRTKLQESVCPEYLRGLRLDHTVWAFSKNDAVDFREIDGGIVQPPEDIHMHLHDPFWLPMSEAGQRVVTTHGDFHPHNLVQAGGETRCVDLEFTCVAAAVVDLAYAMAVIDGLWLVQCHGVTMEENFTSIGDKKRAFIRAYLKGGMAAGSDESPTDEAVEELLLDAQIAMLGGLWSPIGLYKKGNTMFGKGLLDPSTGGYKRRFEHLKSLVQLARTPIDPGTGNPFRASILRNGCWQLFAVEKEYVVLIDRTRNDPFYTPLVFEEAEDMRRSGGQAWRPLTLKSHPGHAVVLSKETWCNKMEGVDVQAATLVIGPSSNPSEAQSEGGCCSQVLHVSCDPVSGYVRTDAPNENRVLTCWSFGCWHGNGPMIVFDREGSTWPESINWPAGLKEPNNPHGQKFEVNADGTMSPLWRPDFVLATQSKS